MYESPIKIFQEQLKLQMEGDILKAVQAKEIVVDKEELLKALEFDRNQYEVGFTDGFKAARTQAEWIYDHDGMDWGIGAWRCNACGAKNNNIRGDARVNPYHWSGSKYCPNCGAIMIGKKEEAQK